MVIPARNEAATVADTVLSVRRALERARHVVHRSVVVVVADSCTDATSSVAADAVGHRGLVIEASHGNVGAARAVGTTAALAAIQRTSDPVWIANTDADTRVTGGWIERQIHLANCGVECVTGIVRLRHGSPGVSAAFRRSYDARLYPGGHDHVHGANFGFHSTFYGRTGPWSHLTTGEDHDLWRRAKADGARCEQDPQLVVWTSPRTVGRAPEGFAADLSRSQTCQPS